MPDIRPGAVRPTPQMGGRKAPAAARAAPLLSAPVRPLLRAVSRQRRRVPRSATTAACWTAATCGCRTSTRTSSGATARCATRSTTSSPRSRRSRPATDRRGAAHYYEVRDGAFNPERRRIMPSGDPAGAYTPSLAAMLIFLNRTGFNGLFRVNARGEFNVPAGRYANPKICDAPNLHAWSAALRRPTCVARGRPVRRGAGGRATGGLHLPRPALRAAERHRPVHVLHGRRFRRRSAGGPPAGGHLARRARGASVLLSNSVAPQIRLLYAGRGAARMAGFRATTVAARRAINSRAASRGPVREYLITNVPRCKLA